MVAIDLRKIMLEERQKKIDAAAAAAAKCSAVSLPARAGARQALLPLESYAVGVDRLQASSLPFNHMRAAGSVMLCKLRSSNITLR